MKKSNNINSFKINQLNDKKEIKYPFSGTAQI